MANREQITLPSCTLLNYGLSGKNHVRTADTHSEEEDREEATTRREDILEWEDSAEEPLGVAKLIKIEGSSWIYYEKTIGEL